jgi:hypothetical protein
MVGKVSKWLLNLKNWLLEWKYVVFGALVPSLVVLWIYCTKSDQDSISCSGMWMQLFAIATVFLEMDRTLKSFNGKGVWLTWLERLKRYPRFTPDGKTIHLHIKEPVKITSIFTQTWDDEAKTTEERLERLENDIVNLRENLKSQQQHTNAIAKSLEGKIDKEVSSLNDADRDILKKLEEVSANGLNIAGMGIFWLFIGVILSSIPSEIEALMLTLHGDVLESVISILQVCFLPLIEIVNSSSLQLI